MKNGYVVTCPKCGAQIDEFTLCDEWFCDCGESGELFGDDDDDLDVRPLPYPIPRRLFE